MHPDDAIARQNGRSGHPSDAVNGAPEPGDDCIGLMKQIRAGHRYDMPTRRNELGPAPLIVLLVGE